MTHNLTNSIIKLTILSLILVGVLTVNYLEAAWSQPSSAPTGGNVALPVNTGTTDQTKDSYFVADGLGGGSLIINPGNATIQGGVRSSSFCDLSGNNCTSAPSLYSLVSNPVDTSSFLDTSNTNQTKSGSLTVNGSMNSDTYCDANGNNCTSAVNLGGSVDTSNFLDKSNTNQTKSGDLELGGLTVNGDPEIKNPNPSVYFNDTDSGERRWLQKVGTNNMIFIMDRNGNSDFSDDGRYDFRIDGGDNRADFSDDYGLFSNQVRATEYCDRSGGNCINPSAFAFECVSGVHRENSGTSIQTSSLGNNYSFSDVFVASFRNSGTQPELRCKGEWTMTGCSAGTDGNGTGDNDETMDGTNKCVGDQAGYNTIHARCCRIVIQ